MGEKEQTVFWLLSTVSIYTHQTEVVTQSLLMGKASLGFLPLEPQLTLRQTLEYFLPQLQVSGLGTTA